MISKRHRLSWAAFMLASVVLLVLAWLHPASSSPRSLSALPPLALATTAPVLATSNPHERETQRRLKAELQTFDGRRLRLVQTLEMVVTAYSPDVRSCGRWADAVTASGKSVWTNAMRLVAADTDLLPFGTIVTVPGYSGGNPVQVLDRGPAIKGQRMDVLMPSHEVARKWGTQPLEVLVWQYNWE